MDIEKIMTAYPAMTDIHVTEGERYPSASMAV